ncbi:hypothetical protein RASY3_00280 [Ruminococcus albus SY3]|uniref:Uncharacterized protein n=1 Tax=Ruminococcus albus SY3 TaxID=1341156 RepID=A0A011WV53_RUMAL|nr:hypothetical protein [Ruminococcus albus]EXM40890.1 hypothetical protein RASY3_00280 [Ruminococcus albus SY3]
MELSRKQINELITGVLLSAEISSSSPELRHFVSVRGYIETERGKDVLDNYINESKLETTVFFIMDYEVPKEYIENDWEIPDNKIMNGIFMEGIVGIENVQKELKKHIPDLSLLKTHWKCAAPLG